MELSIIIPVYNTEAYLRRCIDSVVKQKVKFDYEIIIVNDGSTDSSIDIIKEYSLKYKNIVNVNQNVNQSLAVARKTGIGVSRGNYVMHIDSDDWIEDDSLEKIVSCIKEDDYDVLVYEYAYSDGFKRYNSFKLQHNNLTFNSINKEEIQYLFMGTCVNKLVKNEIIQNLVYGEEYMNTGEDLIYSFEVFLRAKNIRLFKEVIYNYYKNNMSLTSIITANEYFIAQIVLYKEVGKLINQYHPRITQIKKINNYLYIYIQIEIYKHHFSKKNKIDNNTFNIFLQHFKNIDIQRKENIEVVFKSRYKAVIEYIKTYGILRAIKHAIIFSNK